MSDLTHLLDSFRNAAVTEREKGTYFEELIVSYLRNEASYRDLYSKVDLRRLGTHTGNRQTRCRH